MKPGFLLILLTVAASIACGGSSPTGPSAAPNPSPSVRGTWVEAPPTTIGTVEGNPNPAGNTAPFGGPAPGPGTFPGTTYQQVYLGSLFGSSQVRLTGVDFFAMPAYAARGVVSANYAFSLSSTSKPVDGLDLVNLASNVGTDQRAVFNSTLGPGSIVNNVLQIVFSNPFSFTPGSGNLLLQIIRSNPGPSTSVAFVAHAPNDGFPPGLSNRAGDFGTTRNGIYLVTRFHHQRCQCPTTDPCSC